MENGRRDFMNLVKAYKKELIIANYHCSSPWLQE